MDKTEELVLKVQRGDKDAFEALFNLYKTKAMRLAYLITNNQTLSDDITQEAFVQSYLNIKSLRNPQQFKTWFFKILTRLAWKMSTKEKKVIALDAITEPQEVDDRINIENDFIQKEKSEAIMAAIRQLELKQRTVILLYYYNDFSIAEIAQILGCFEGTVKSRLHSARKQLSKSLITLQDESFEEVKADEIIYEF